MKHAHRVRIGPFALTLRASGEQWQAFGALLEKEYGAYDRPGGTVRCRIELRDRRLAPRALCRGAGDELSLAKAKGGWRMARYDFFSSSTKDFRATTLFIDCNKYSLNSWLRIFLTQCGLRYGALLVHSAGISCPEGIYLFAGVSGSGKSTITRIFGKRYALSDELVLLYEQRGTFMAASTPFWGELKKGTGTLFCGRAEGICFLSHGRIVRRSPAPASCASALAQLLKTVLFFSDDSSSMRTLLGLAARAVKNVPVSRLGFAKTSTRKELLAALTAP